MEFTFEENAEVEADVFETVVPAEHRALYAKGTDGKFRVGDTFKAIAATFDGLTKNLKASRTTNQRVGNEARERREALEAWASKTGFATADEVKAKIDELTQQIASKSNIKPEDIRAAIEAEINPKLAAAEKSRDDMFGTLKEHLIDNQLLTAIGEHKGNAKLLLPHLKGRMDVIKDEQSGKYVAVVKKPDGDGYEVGSDGGYLPAAKLVERFKADKDFAGCFEGTQKSGGGTPTPQPGTRQPVNTGQQELRGVGKISAGLQQR